MGAKLDSGVGKRRGRPDINAEPNVIPFIDVMLVLLIIFMVTAPIAAVDIKADMPDSETITTKRPPKPVWVTLIDGDDCVNPVTRQPVTVKGVPVTTCPSYFVMEDQVSVNEIGPKVFEYVDELNPKFNSDKDVIRDERIFLRASGRTQYKNVMLVMNRLQDEGFTKIALVSDDRTP